MNTKHQEEKTSQRPRWSVMDTCILLLVLAALGGLIYRVVDAALRDGRDEARDMYAVYFTVETTHEDILHTVQGFDPVYDYEDGTKLGYIAAYEDPDTGDYLPALTVTQSAEESGEGKVTASGCLICTAATAKGGSLLVDGSGRYLIPGGVVTIRTDRALLTVRITEIRLHR